MGTEQKIVQASLQLFARKGFEATSIRDIALEAGVNSSTLYYYITSKDDFLVSIMKKGLEELIIQSIKIIRDLDTPEQRLASLVQLHVMAHGRHHLAMLVTDTEYRALSGENKENIRKLRKEYEKIWFKVLEEGIQKGIFKKITNIKITTYALLSMCTGIVHWYSPTGDMSLEEISKDYANMSLNLLVTPIDGKEVTVDSLNIPQPSTHNEYDFEISYRNKK